VRRPPELIGICLWAAACFSPEIPEGSVCTNVCPAPLACINGRCVDGVTIDGGGVDGPFGLCPAGYVLNAATGSRYRVVNTAATWMAAVSDCFDDGGSGGLTYLAVPDSSIENGVIDSLATNDSWLGITDVGMDGFWFTVLGLPQTYFQWASGQPNGGDIETCAFVANATWQDASCQLAKPYVCECR
jgi:hypothetical protein